MRKKNTGKYQFYDENHLPETYTYERKDDYKPRKNQQETIDKFKDAVAKKRKKLLMYAVMRFGKSFTSMCCADEIKAGFVVVVSAKADVKEEWKKTVESHKRFVQYEFATSANLKANKKFISESKKAGKKIVLFLTLQDLQGKEMKDKHNELLQKQK
jgi:Type III restriction enzyme, res subunit.